MACGTVDPNRDAGPPDAGKPDGGSGMLPVTCFSNMRWTEGNTGKKEMNPGYACRACHLGDNFLGQNPNRVYSGKGAKFFMGTVYGEFNEADLCSANAVPDGTVVEILDSTGQLKLTLPVDKSGNFESTSVAAQVSLPYKARVRSNGRVRPMGDAQMNGDCNTCHTEQGRENAPGRIVWP